MLIDFMIKLIFIFPLIYIFEIFSSHGDDIVTFKSRTVKVKATFIVKPVKYL